MPVMMTFNPRRRLTVTISIDAAKVLVRAANLLEVQAIINTRLSSVERRLMRQVIEALHKHVQPFLKQPDALDDKNEA